MSFENIYYIKTNVFNFLLILVQMPEGASKQVHKTFQVHFDTDYTDGSKFSVRVNTMSSSTPKWLISD